MQRNMREPYAVTYSKLCILWGCTAFMAAFGTLGAPGCKTRDDYCVCSILLCIIGVVLFGMSLFGVPKR